jgi:hypothetical protein
MMHGGGYQNFFAENNNNGGSGNPGNASPGLGDVN